MTTATKTKIWDLRAEGIAIRDEGLRTDDSKSWYPKAVEWEDKIVEAVAEYDPNFARRLKPLGALLDVGPCDSKHQRDVIALTTIITLVTNWLGDDA